MGNPLFYQSALPSPSILLVTLENAEVGWLDGSGGDSRVIKIAVSFLSSEFYTTRGNGSRTEAEID